MTTRATALFWLLDWERFPDGAAPPARRRPVRAIPGGADAADTALSADVASFRRLLRLLDEGLAMAEASGKPEAVRFYEDLALEVFRIIRASKR
jgi:hypothetical protein